MIELWAPSNVRRVETFAAAAFLLALAACGNPFPQPVACEGGCVDACGKWPPNNIQQKRAKHAQCAADYEDGYGVGYCAGIQGEHVFGVNSDGYVAGYYDGFADGEAVQSSDRERRACAY